MKRYLVITAVVCMGLCCSSCKNIASKIVSAIKDKTEDTTPVVPPDPYAAYPKVYSNAYDGFANIRQQPDAKAQVVSILRNGPQGAALLGYEGKWAKVVYNGVTGYIYSPYITTTPTREVLVDITTGWLFGRWSCSHYGGTNTINIKKNGTWDMEGNMDELAIFYKGNWYLEGDEIVLRQTSSEDMDGNYFNYTGKRYRLDEYNHTMDGWRKGRR